MTMSLRGCPVARGLFPFLVLAFGLASGCKEPVRFCGQKYKRTATSVTCPRPEVRDITLPEIRDLTPLSKLTKLRELRIANTQVTDLAPLASNRSLKVLDLGNTPVSDLAPLRKLVSLERLHLNNTAVRDLTPLKKLTKLVLLDVTKTKVSEAQITALRESLPNLNIVY